jgi:TusA-related sulfurtransferase
MPGMKRITGLAEELIPRILDRSVIDDTTGVSDENAYRTAIDLARKEGIPVGPTTGAILFAALRFAMSGKGLAVVISPDDAFKYTSFYKDFLESESETKELPGSEYDLCDLVCPLSKIKATEVLDSLEKGRTVRIVLGNADSLASVARELKIRGIKPDFQKEAEDRFVLTVTK